MAAQPTQDTVPSTAPLASPAAEDLPEEAAHGQGVADIATDPSLTGCEKGQAVADVASAQGAENSKDRGKKKDPCARAGIQGKPKSGRPGDVPTGLRGRSKGWRGDSHRAGGVGTTTVPGLGEAGPEVRGSKGARGGGGGPKVGGRGVPEDLPTP